MNTFLLLQLAAFVGGILGGLLCYFQLLTLAENEARRTGQTLPQPYLGVIIAGARLPQGRLPAFGFALAQGALLWLGSTLLRALSF